MKNIYVFDMGRVILKGANLEGMYKESDTECDYQTFKNIFYNSKESKDVYSGIIDDNTFFGIIKHQTRSKRSVEELQKLYLKSKGEVYNDTIKIIKELKEKDNMVCLLSNLKVIDYNYLCSVMDINLFDKTFLSYLMHMAKPDSEIYKRVIEELGTNDFYFFDDTKSNIDSAKKLGINAFNVTGDNIKDCFRRKLIKK